MKSPQRSVRLTPIRIVKELEKRKFEIRRRGVTRIGLFGSYLKRKSRKASDLDFLVEFKEPTFDDYFELKQFLERTFHKKVDLVIAHTLKPSMKYVKEEALYAKV